MIKQTSGRSFHCVTFTDAEISFLKHMVTATLRDINETEQELKKAENEVWANCNPASFDISSRISFIDLNLIRTMKRDVQKKKKQYEAIQKALRACLNFSV